jgi:2',3'-cyclic-nucleotide 2'-phosphodiesterase (5'-nucleotidase family)
VTQAQVADSPLIDLINKVQIEKVKQFADPTAKIVSAAALLDSNANVKPGDITLANVANIYKYDNTLMGLKVFCYNIIVTLLYKYVKILFLTLRTSNKECISFKYNHLGCFLKSSSQFV